MSVTDYRNQLRFARFQALLGRGGENVKSAARQAGFGSYAQFHRVFRAHARTSPREYLRRTRAERDLRP
jgi:transcriptional regulator GlxA family with amidase domain